MEKRISRIPTFAAADIHVTWGRYTERQGIIIILLR